MLQQNLLFPVPNNIQTVTYVCAMRPRGSDGPRWLRNCAPPITCPPLITLIRQINPSMVAALQRIPWQVVALVPGRGFLRPSPIPPPLENCSSLPPPQGMLHLSYPSFMYVTNIL
jgi:hypothetical protein